MEVGKIPANNDAEGEEPKLNNISSGESVENNSVEKAEPVIKPAVEDKDDLLSKIEEAVKDPTLSQNIEDDISKSSADDFLKKIDEIEKEDKSNGEVLKPQQGAVEKIPPATDTVSAPATVTAPIPAVPEPEIENNKNVEEKECQPSNIEEISSDSVSVAVVEESTKDEPKRSEAMSVDNSEGSSDDVMEVDGDIEKPSEEKMDVVEEKAVESIEVDLEESPKPQDVEINDVQQTEINDVEIKEVSPEVNDVEIKEISDDSNDVEIVENSEKESDVEQKMKELHGEGKSSASSPTVKNVSELSVEEQVKQLESIAHSQPQKSFEGKEKPAEVGVQKEQDEVDKSCKKTEPANIKDVKEKIKSESVKATQAKQIDKAESSGKEVVKPDVVDSLIKSQEPSKVGTETGEKVNGLLEVSNDAESNSEKVDDAPSKEEATETLVLAAETHAPVSDDEKDKEKDVAETTDVIDKKPVEKCLEKPKTCYNLEFSCSDKLLNHFKITTNTPDKSIPSENHTFSDLVEACDFVIKKLSELKKAICPESVVTRESTPKQSNRKSAGKASPAIETPAKSGGKRGNKRSLLDDDESIGTPKKMKKETVVEEDHSSKQRVLAKWVDKLYYAGRVVGEKPNNKFAILFEDGALKNLPRESIVFSDNAESDVLPLKGHEIYALVNDDEYECGMVESVDTDTDNNKTIYNVKCETKTVSVTAMQMYLEEDQAKLINKSVDGVAGASGASTPSGRGSRNKRAAEVSSPNTPEAGFSGGVTGKRGNKRQKRYS